LLAPWQLTQRGIKILAEIDEKVDVNPIQSIATVTISEADRTPMTMA
jgi:hypothetical protein